jgi:predicted MFS family arabinose efflux permease
MDDVGDARHPDWRGPSHGRLVLPSLMFSMFATYPASVVASLLLVDMGLAFGRPIGVMAQMMTISSTVALVSASALGALSVRFRAKMMLIAGLLFLSVSALGSGSAASLEMLFASYAMTGLGTSMVEPMISTLIAENFPVERRPKIIGWVNAGGGLSYTVGASAVGFIAGLCGWRMAFLGYVMILPLLAFTISYLGIPSLEREPRPSQIDLTEGLKSIFSNRSAVACLLGNLLASTMAVGIYFYSFSFLREIYQMTPGWTAIVFSAASVCFLLGSLVSGAFIDRLGRKTAVISSLLIFSLSTIIYTNFRYMLLGVAFTILGHLFGALRYSASASLSLEQVPYFRGSMMSMNSAAGYSGTALGTALGGLMLLSFDWSILGMVLGAIGIVGAGLYHAFASDPTRTSPDTKPT